MELVRKPDYMGIGGADQKSILELFFRDCRKNNLSEDSLKTYKKAYKSFYSYLKDAGIINPQGDDVINYREYLLGGHKAATVELYLTALRVFFKWADREGYYPDITKGIKAPRPVRVPKRDYFSPQSITQILDSISSSGSSLIEKRDYALMSTMVVLGLRDIEASRALWSDIETRGSSWVLVVHGKGRDEKGDFVVIPVRLKKILDEYKISLGNHFRPDGPIFPSFSNKNTKKPMTARSISRIVKTRFIEAGYDSPRLTAHSLRHTNITLALESGIPLEEVQQHARHKNMNTTLIYDHALKQEKNRASGSAADKIFGS